MVMGLYGTLLQKEIIIFAINIIFNILIGHVDNDISSG